MAYPLSHVNTYIPANKLVRKAETLINLMTTKGTLIPPPTMLISQGLTVIELINTINDLVISEGSYFCILLVLTDSFSLQGVGQLSTRS
jgi:hypothetical protein